MKTVIDSFNGEYRFLSNFWETPIKIEGLTFRSVENAFQAAKSTSQIDWIAFQNISPAESKKMGRRLNMRPDWDSGFKHIAMKVLLEIKFNDPALRRRLIETQDAELIEGNHWGDTYWGVCKGIGQNHLGKLLMQIREEIK